MEIVGSESIYPKTPFKFTMNVIENIRKSKFLIDFLSILSSNVSLLFIGIFTSIINNRVLGPDGIGLYAILTNFTLLFVSMAELGIRQSTIFFAGKGTYKLNEILSANANIWILSSFIGMVIFYFIFQNNKVDVSIGVLIFSALIIPATIANSFINGIMLGADKIQKTASFNIANGILKLLLIALLVWALNLYVLGAILALLIPAITLVFRKYFYLRKTETLKLKFTFNIEIIKRLIGHGLLYGVALFLMGNQKKIPILVMTGRISGYDIGIYYAGFAFADLLYNVHSALAPIIFVRTAKAKDPIENSLKVQKLMRVVFVILLFISTILYFGLEFIIPLMFGEKFTDSIPITRILLIGTIFYNVLLILNMDLAGQGKPWIAIYTLVPITLINFISNYYFIGIFGNVGAAYSTSVSMAIAAIIFLFFYSKEIKVPLLQIIRPQKSDWDFVSKLLKKA